MPSKRTVAGLGSSGTTTGGSAARAVAAAASRASAEAPGAITQSGAPPRAGRAQPPWPQRGARPRRRATPPAPHVPRTPRRAADDPAPGALALNWRAGANRACFEAFGPGADGALDVDYRSAYVDGEYRAVQVFSNATTGSWYTDCNARVPLAKMKEHETSGECKSKWAEMRKKVTDWCMFAPDGKTINVFKKE